jgi:hypothetical protein
MSTMAFVQGRSSVIGAWDTKEQIYMSQITPATTEFTRPQSAPGTGNARKHPALAIHSQGETILVWTEGTGWQKGGALIWQVFDKNGKALGSIGRERSGVPVWGLPTVVATDDGFTILY